MSSGFKKLPELIQVLIIVFTRKIIYNDHFNPEPISQENKVLCEEFIAEYLLNGRTENEISNNQTFEDFKENLETRLTEIENVIGLEKSGNFEIRLNRIKEHLINVNGQVSTRNTGTKKIWVKFNENAIKIVFNGEDVFDLVEEATTKLSGLDNYRMDLIEAYKHNSSEPLRFGDMVDGSFINQYETPILIRIKTQQ
ncbi:unnamed protein product [Rhizophagus irregularis]|uniref:Uncharacterized protein n=1 Tax=Rhizophagus irregularis TaxID=588596 RepID=A0A2N1NQR9_9GLOM|nr:hypothetical protein RhiirC2_845390 [Rhizophagus irregularis]CAB4384022.1 unnamed protein product [Rhizophagus irregularis]CAB5361089.1 unnamed protein product [Rhizophagus irregularis]